MKILGSSQNLPKISFIGPPGTGFSLIITRYVLCFLPDRCLEPFGPVSPKSIPVRFRSGIEHPATARCRPPARSNSSRAFRRQVERAMRPKPGWRACGGCRNAADRGGSLAWRRISDYF